MRVDHLHLENFRNHTAVALPLPAGLIMIVGPNGAGKTNLIEAVAVAALGRSPRTATDTDLVRRHSAWCKITLRAQRATGPMDVAVTVSALGAKTTTLNGHPCRRRADLFGELPVVSFFPGDLDLVKGAPGRRRRFLDLLAAQCEPRHVADVQTYERVLRQRNTLLRDIRSGRSAKGLLDMFDEQLVTAGAAVVNRRLRFMVQLQRAAAPQQRAIGGEELGLAYMLAGRKAHYVTATVTQADLEAGARQQLALLSDDEVRRGYSLWGPHRDDLAIGLNGEDARFYASQGQQRTVILALKAAEIELLTGIHRETPLVILDDVLSELDRGRVAAFLEQLAAIEQVFITATSVLPDCQGAMAILAVTGGTVENLSAGARRQ